MIYPRDSKRANINNPFAKMIFSNKTQLCSTNELPQARPSLDYASIVPPYVHQNTFTG